MTGLIFLLALIDFWTGVILSILSGLGVISTPIWVIALVTGTILIVLITALYFASIKEYGPFTDDYIDYEDEGDLDLDLKLTDARSALMHNEHD